VWVGGWGGDVSRMGGRGGRQGGGGRKGGGGRGRWEEGGVKGGQSSNSILGSEDYCS